MAKPKTPAPSSDEVHARRYKNKQPPDIERWNHMQFRQWLKDMGYPRKPAMDARSSFPYDQKQIAGDLGTTTDRVYAYWRGQEKGKPVVLTKTMTLLCKGGLELKPLGKWPL